MSVCGGSAHVGRDKSSNMRGMDSFDGSVKEKKKQKGRLSLRWCSEEPSVSKIKTDG